MTETLLTEQNAQERSNKNDIAFVNDTVLVREIEWRLTASDTKNDTSFSRVK